MFERGFVTYSNAAKTELVGVPAALIKTHGAVSAEVARAMAEGALIPHAPTSSRLRHRHRRPRTAAVLKNRRPGLVRLRRRDGDCTTIKQNFDGDRVKTSAAPNP